MAAGHLKLDRVGMALWTLNPLPVLLSWLNVGQRWSRLRSAGVSWHCTGAAALPHPPLTRWPGMGSSFSTFGKKGACNWLVILVKWPFVTSYPAKLAGTEDQPGCGEARRRYCGIVGKGVKPGQQMEWGDPTSGECDTARGKRCHQGTPLCVIPTLTHKDLIHRFKNGKLPEKAVARIGNIYV